MAGYSGTPLWRKLGLREGGRLVLVGAPEDFQPAELPPEAEVERRSRVPRSTAAGAGAGAPTLIAFHRERARLEKALPALARTIFPDGAVWIAWPRRASGGVSDIRESDIREAALALGLVDVKVAALGERWSGLRLVWRRELRGPGEPPRRARG